MIMLVLGGLLIGVAAALDMSFRLRMRETGHKWAILQGGAFDYAEYHRVRKEHGWPGWPVYFMWIAVICGIILLIAGAFIYLGTSPRRTDNSISSNPVPGQDNPADVIPSASGRAHSAPVPPLVATVSSTTNQKVEGKKTIAIGFRMKTREEIRAELAKMSDERLIEHEKSLREFAKPSPGCEGDEG